MVLEAEIAVDLRFVGREEAKRGQAVPDVHPHLRAFDRDVLRLRSEPVRRAELQESAAMSHHTERHDRVRGYYVPAMDIHFDREASLCGERRWADDVHEQPAVAAKNLSEIGRVRREIHSRMVVFRLSRIFAGRTEADLVLVRHP